jgi:NAD-dependent deacetylase
MIPDDLTKKLIDFACSDRHFTVLTGAGISVESDIPTFRGPGGYWQVGSKEYHPQEMATRSMFEKDPDSVWGWYLYRRGVCRKALPNRGHLALVEMERLFPGRFTLVTQNVDGLHLLAGSDPMHTYEIHGNIFYMRCDRGCAHTVYPIPDEVPDKMKGESLTDNDRRLLRCPNCGEIARPHILWFDESYNEEFYHYVSALKMSTQTGLLLVVGTSGSTNLPILIGQKVGRRNGLIVDVNIRENPFSEMAMRSGGGFIQGTCSEALPEILKIMADVGRERRSERR